MRFYAPDGSGGSAPQPVGAESTGAGAPALAVAADGRALLAWPRLDRPGGTIRLLVAERPPGGAFGDPVPIDAAGAGFSEVAMSDGGDGFATWTAGASPPYELHVRGFDAKPPTLSGVAIPANATIGAPAAFSASPFDVWGPVTTSWSFGDGATATGASAPARLRESRQLHGQRDDDRRGRQRGHEIRDGAGGAATAARPPAD